MLANKDVVDAIYTRAEPWLLAVLSATNFGTPEHTQNYCLDRFAGVCSASDDKRFISIGNLRRLINTIADITLGVVLAHKDTLATVILLEKSLQETGKAFYGKDGLFRVVAVKRDDSWTLPTSGHQQLPAKWAACSTSTLCFESKHLYTSKRTALDAMHQSNRQRRQLEISARPDRLMLRKASVCYK